LFVFVLGGIVEELIRDVGNRDIVNTSINLAAAIIVVGGITFSWLQTFHTGRFAAALAGGLAGFILGGLERADVLESARGSAARLVVRSIRGSAIWPCFIDRVRQRAFVLGTDRVRWRFTDA
jgi:hypothetical protein